MLLMLLLREHAKTLPPEMLHFCWFQLNWCFLCARATLANCLPLLIAHLIRSLWVSLLASCLSLCACVCLSSLSGCLVPCDDWHQHDLHDCLVSVPMMSFGWLFLTEWLTEITCWWWRWKLWTGVCKLRFSQLNNFFFFLHFSLLFLFTRLPSATSLPLS